MRQVDDPSRRGTGVGSVVGGAADVGAAGIARSLGRALRTVPTVYLLLLLAAAVELLFPVSLDAWSLRIVMFANIFVIYAVSYDLLAGYAGLVSFGHSLFFGGAGYVSGLLSLHLGWPLFLTMTIAWVAVLIAAFFVGYVSLRLKGPYLAVVTLVFPLVLTNLLFLSPRFLGGDDGIAGFSQLADGSMTAQFYAVLAVAILSVLVILRLARSNFGLILTTVREDEIGAEASGVDSRKYKILAFVLSGGFAGLAGTFYAHIMGSVGPTTLSPHYSMLPLIMISLGGAASVVGAAVGAYAITLLDLYLLAFPYLRVIVYAAIIIAVLRFFPGGLMAVFGGLRRLVAWRS